MEQNSIHGEVEGTFTLLERDGQKILQLTTYGSPTRQNKGSGSQTIQLDEEGAANLYRIIKDHFGFR